jgi:DNA uptake protein ComE-like DNA-binding protein
MNSANWFAHTPSWFNWALVPVVGGLGLSYAGWKIKTRGWILGGLLLTGASLCSLALPESFIGPTLTFLWLTQGGIALAIKKNYLVKTYPLSEPLPSDAQLARLVAQNRPPVDINRCSKNDLIYKLGLPIVYANAIESLQQEGYLLTSPEELVEIVGIPEETVHRIAPMLMFSYDFKRESISSWRRFNTYSAAELEAAGMDPTIAARLVEERARKGPFRSAIDAKQRVGFNLSAYQRLL